MENTNIPELISKKVKFYSKRFILKNEIAYKELANSPFDKPDNSITAEKGDDKNGL